MVEKVKNLLELVNEKFLIIIDEAFTLKARMGCYTLNNEMIANIISLYKEYQELECGSVDYLFNIHDKDDVISCLGCGLPIKELSDLYRSIDGTKTDYFLFGSCNHKQAELIDYEQMEAYFKSYSNELVTYLYKYPFNHKYLYYRLFAY